MRGASAGSGGEDGMQAVLRQLEQTHDRMFDEMAVVDGLTRAVMCDWRDFSAARWRLSEASLARRHFAMRTRAFLLARAARAERIALASLAAADQAMLARSTAHVRDWTPDAIRGDWPAYCAASRQIRAEMAAFLRAEERVLRSIVQAIGADSVPGRAA